MKPTDSLTATSYFLSSAQWQSLVAVIIRPEHYKTWLDPQLTDVSKIQTLIGPYPKPLMEAYPVSTKVNSPKNDTFDLTAELTC